MRVLISMLKHETNSFSPIKTDINRFREWSYFEDEKVVEQLSGCNLAISGFIEETLDKNIEIISPLAAEAMPSGPADHETFWQLKEKIHTSIKNINILMLDLHGAMVTETTLDAEGYLLEEIRRKHPEIPMAIALDFHANISDLMIDNANIICGFHTYPHTDMKETGQRAAILILDTAAGKITPTLSFGRLPILPHTLKQGTDDEPFRSIMKLCREKEQLQNVLDISFFGGFPLSDTPFTGPSVVVITDNNPVLGEKVKNEIIAFAWARRKEFTYKLNDLTYGLERIKNMHPPLLLLDHSDNCGSGGTQDVMAVIKAVRDAKLQDVIVAAVCDSYAVQMMQVAGIDQIITLEIGGKTSLAPLDIENPPLTMTGKVKALTDGRWKIHGKMYSGTEVNMGPSAVLDTGDLKLIITSRHIEPWDKGIFIACGINPEQHNYILLKSRIHHRCSFRTITLNELPLDGEGVTTSDYKKLPFRHLPEELLPQKDLDLSWGNKGANPENPDQLS